jgi:hypothetical protein
MLYGWAGKYVIINSISTSVSLRRLSSGDGGGRKSRKDGSPLGESPGTSIGYKIRHGGFRSPAERKKPAFINRGPGYLH